MNIALRIVEAAKLYPEKKSVVLAHDNSFYTFREFEERSNQIANRLTSLGIKKGTRTLLFVKPCLDFSIITFALFKIGAIPVLIDPGMGLKNLLSSVAQVKPSALISIGKVHWLRRFMPQSFKTVEINISLQRVGGSTHFLYEGLTQEKKSFSPAEVSPSDYSAILFTSGGTGIPKGVLYTHGILNAQTEALREMFSLGPKETDLPGFPLFALFTLAMGMTSVIPQLDPTRPAQCDPKKIVKNILDHKITFVAGSPAIWERVGRYCLEQNITLPGLKYVVMFGAPVRLEIHEMFQRILPDGTTYTPYGATESLPVSLISGQDVLQTKSEAMLRGAGTCIGKAVPGTVIKVMKVSDIPEKNLLELPRGEVGEILVSGAQVTPAYFEMESETQKAKIYQDGKLWHRMGDMGHMDESGDLWFCGRKTHRVEASDGETYYSIQVEAIFNQHPEVKRTALIKREVSGVIYPALVIERKDGKKKISHKEKFVGELKALGEKYPHTKVIQEFYLHNGFPVDVRHNIKIDRVALGRWVADR